MNFAISGTVPKGADGKVDVQFLANDPAILAHDADMKLGLVADASIYNLVELSCELGLSRSTPVASLLLAGYRRWGPGLPQKLDGDFALAIWDSAARTLFCARDRFGVRPLCYRELGDRLVFSSDPQFLPQLPPGGSDLEEWAIADFLVGRVIEGNSRWKAISTLPPGHSLTYRNGSTEVRQYVNLEIAAECDAREAPERFAQLFRNSIRKRTRQADKLGCLLSGGLDSTSIACVTRDHLASHTLLATYSMTFADGGANDDKPFIDVALRNGGFRPTVIERESYAPLDGLNAMLEEQGGPFLAPNLIAIKPLVERAADDGIAVLLDGHGGDEVVSHGFGRLDELAAAGRWMSLAKECGPIARDYGKARHELVGAVARRTHGRSARLIYKAVGSKKKLRGSEKCRAPMPGWPSKDLIENTRLDERLRQSPPFPSGATEPQQHCAQLKAPLQPYAFEVLARFYRGRGIGSRFPFWDKELVSFCLSLPSIAKLEGGQTRVVLRRAMKGTVPQPILQRRGKMDFTAQLKDGMVAHHSSYIKHILHSDALEPYVDLEAARAAFALMQGSGENNSANVQAVWRVVALGAWVEMRRSITKRAAA